MFTQKACIKSRPAVMITVTSPPGKKFYRTSGRMGHNPGQAMMKMFSVFLE